jgi:MscS family membrane protein
MPNRCLSYLLLCTVLFLNTLVFQTVSAEEVEAPTIKDLAEKEKAEEEVIKKLVEAPVAGPYDELNRSTPRSSLLALSIEVNDKNYEKAAEYLDLRNLPFETEGKAFDGAELVRKLAIVARRVMKIDLEALSEDPKGHEDDGLPSFRDRITTLDTQNGKIDILMQRVPRGDGEFIWKISNATVALIPELYEEFGYGVVGDRLSTILPPYQLLGLELWQLVMLAAIIIAAFFIAYLLSLMVLWLLRRGNYYNIDRLQKFVAGPFRFLVIVLFIRASFELISPSLKARAIFEAQTLLIIAIVWISFGLVELIKYKLADRMQRNGQPDAVVLLRPAATATKFILMLIGLISWMDNLGYEVTTLLAGLGIGGVAVALAAQKSMENLIGSIMIYTSQPVKVGDFCRYGTDIGTVEEIGLRSTQLRTLARSIVHIPNAQFSAGVIENLTQRDKILYRTRLRLSYETSAQQIQQVLDDVRRMMHDYEDIDDENSRIRFIEFGKYANELELFAYIRTQEFPVYLEKVEDVNLKIAGILDKLGVKIALPANATYVAGREFAGQAADI